MLTWSTFSQVPFFCFSFDTTDCLFFYLKYFSIQIFTFSYLEVKKKLAKMDMMEQVIDPAKVYMKDAMR